MRTVLQFPTFPMRDPELSTAAVPGLDALLAAWVDRVGAFVPVTPTTFAFPDRATLVDDVAATREAHVACFIENLAVAEWYAAHGRVADAVTSYSMGLYPALVHVEALAIGDALHVMAGACEAAHAGAGAGPYAMLAVTGPDADALLALCAHVAPAVELTDRYAPDTQLLTGRTDEVRAVQAATGAQGWTDTLLLPVSAPFHSTVLRSVRSALAVLLADVSVAAPRWPLRSSTAPQWLRTAADVHAEILRNVWSPMDWAGTVQAIAAEEPTEFIECGLSRRLSRVAQRLLGPAHRTRGIADDAIPTADV
jgi:malonyl CoA-acyl carrier protein transacylase